MLSAVNFKSLETLKSRTLANMSIESDFDLKQNNNSQVDVSANTISSSNAFTKITVENVASENNSNSLNISNNSLNSANTIVRKIKDFGMFGAVNNAAGNTRLTTTMPTATQSLIARKRPLSEIKANLDGNKPGTPNTKKSRPPKDGTTTATTPKTAKKLQKAAMNLNGIVAKPAGTPGRKGLPLPQAVARRNARERNRVKQVNNGFAALRERIPEEVAEAFESQNGPKNNNSKKLSKVETLRMAVEYIRSLERLLGFDISMSGGDSGVGADVAAHSSSSGEDSYSLIKDEFDILSPSLDDQGEDSLSNYDADEYFTPINENNNNNNHNSMPHSEYFDTLSNFNEHLNSLPNITTLNGLQYIRIPGTSTYRLLTPDVFVGAAHSPPNSSLDDEQFNALIDTNYMSPLATAAPSPSSQLRAGNQLHAAAPLSPSTINATTASSNDNNGNMHSIINPSIYTVAAAPPATPTTCCTIKPLTITTNIETEATANNNDNNGDCVNILGPSSSPVSSSSSAILSRSTPVPQSAAGIRPLTIATAITPTPATTTEPTPSPNVSKALHERQSQEGLHSQPELQQQQQQQQQQSRQQQESQEIAMLSPAINDEFLLQQTACATAISRMPQFVAPTLPHLLPPLRMIKQEYNAFVPSSPTLSNNTMPADIIVYQTSSAEGVAQQQQHFLLGHESLAMSPPSISQNRCTNALIATAQSISDLRSLHSFYESDENQSFYETNDLSLKKEIDEVLLDASNVTGSGGALSDESIIETIDWWEAHTPKSDSNNSVIL